MVGIRRNRWTACAGIGGRFPPDYACGIYGIGHLLTKRWTSGLLLFFFSFIWLFVEGIVKDVVLRGNFQSGLCALAFHLPVILISIKILSKPVSKQ